MADVHIFAKIRPKTEHYSEVLSALQAIVVATREELGCKRFELNTGVADDHSLYLLEIWKSDAALEGHHEMPHTMEAAQHIDGKLIVSTEVVKMITAS